MRWGGVESRKSRIQLAHTYEDIISVENLLEAWKEYVRGKHKKKDVQEFLYRLMDNILDLHRDLKNGTYRHGDYRAFKISDPKPRDIHKASVRDRLVHHALHRKLYPFFDRTFIADSYSCRAGKGTHKALNQFRVYAYKVSMNHTRTCWVLKCDIRKFFASIDHGILFNILSRYISDEHTAQLLVQIASSFSSTQKDKGLPLGNLTSQLLVNVYMNALDQYVKHHLKVKYYIRYADDFVILSLSKQYLQAVYRYIGIFLHQTLRLELHLGKVSITSFASGVNFLGWVHFPNHRVLRTSTRRRMLCALGQNGNTRESIQSYIGLLSHGNTYKLSKIIQYESDRNTQQISTKKEPHQKRDR
jgi:retron-type reverse transcriptase